MAEQHPHCILTLLVNRAYHISLQEFSLLLFNHVDHVLNLLFSVHLVILAQYIRKDLPVRQHYISARALGHWLLNALSKERLRPVYLLGVSPSRTDGLLLGGSIGPFGLDGHSLEFRLCGFAKVVDSIAFARCYSSLFLVKVVSKLESGLNCRLLRSFNHFPFQWPRTRNGIHQCLWISLHKHEHFRPLQLRSLDL